MLYPVVVSIVLVRSSNNLFHVDRRALHVQCVLQTQYTYVYCSVLWCSFPHNRKHFFSRPLRWFEEGFLGWDVFVFVLFVFEFVFVFVFFHNFKLLNDPNRHWLHRIVLHLFILAGEGNEFFPPPAYPCWCLPSGVLVVLDPSSCAVPPLPTSCLCADTSCDCPIQMQSSEKLSYWMQDVYCNPAVVTLVYKYQTILLLLKCLLGVISSFEEGMKEKRIRNSITNILNIFNLINK